VQINSQCDAIDVLLTSLMVTKMKCGTNRQQRKLLQLTKTLKHSMLARSPNISPESNEIYSIQHQALSTPTAPKTCCIFTNIAVDKQTSLPYDY